MPSPDELINQAEEVLDKFSVVREQGLTLEKTKSSLQSDLTRTESNLLLGRQSMEVVEKWMRENSKAGVEQIQDLINQGLEYIFFDRSYRFEMKIEEEGKEVTFLLHNLQSGVLCNINDMEIGGGPSVIISLLLNVVFLFVYKCRRFLVLDEALTQISDDYIERLFEFIKALVGKYQFDILIVTHDLRVKAFADKIYQVSDGGHVKQLEQLKIEPPS